MFVDGNLEKRLEKLQNQLAFVAEVFGHFDELLQDYIRNCKSDAFDSVTSDGERMLAWLAATRALTPKQQDYVACQRARHAVENLARENRLKHIRFQELSGLTDQWLKELDTNTELRVYLNPIRVWARFATPVFLDDDATPPADVLFFAVGSEIHTAVLELEGQSLINELADYQPCTFAEWAAVSRHGDRADLIESSRDLAELGLLAFG
jgi:hypothetical protein